MVTGHVLDIEYKVTVIATGEREDAALEATIDALHALAEHIMAPVPQSERLALIKTREMPDTTFFTKAGDGWQKKYVTPTWEFRFSYSESA